MRASLLTLTGDSSGRSLSVIAALMTLCALSWAYLWAVPMPMSGMDTRISPGFVLLRFLMWFIMMLAMMTPANLPAVEHNSLVSANMGETCAKP